MKFTELPIKGAILIEQEPFADNRGFFTRLFCQEEFIEAGLITNIAQINHSVTAKKGTVRGIHLQESPASETKIVRCIKGKVFDVLLDLREGSDTFLKWHAVELSDSNYYAVSIPEGVAHGFQTLTDNCELIYLHSKVYTPGKECCVPYNDAKVNIKWPLEVSVISDKDLSYNNLDDSFKGIK